MKKVLWIVVLLCLPTWILAQNRAEYQPGRWYIGLRIEGYMLDGIAKDRGSYYDNTSNFFGSGVGIVGGRLLSRHFALQAGLLVNKPSSDNRIKAVARNDLVTAAGWRRPLGRGVYIPLSVRYIPFGAERCFQPYVVAGISTSIGRTTRSEWSYDSRIPLDEPPVFYENTTQSGGIRMLFGLQAGVGVNVRLYRPLHLSCEFMLNQNLSDGGKGGFFTGLGLLYDIGSR